VPTFDGINDKVIELFSMVTINKNNIVVKKKCWNKNDLPIKYCGKKQVKTN